MAEETALAKPQRLTSLDVFRGITIAGMILVNNPGSWSYVYRPLGHAKFHGWTPTDLIFPFFLFIVGVAMTFSFDRRLSRGDSRNTLFLHVARRSAILFILGLLLAGFPYYNLNFSTIRIPGVLQRIGVCYFFASIIVMHTGWKGRLFWALFFIAIYWDIVALIPAPHGYTPIGKGIILGGNEGLLGDFIDTKILGGHLYRERPDPEGILSTLPAISTTLLGVLVGNWLHSSRSHLEKILGMFIMANVCIVLGQVMDIWLPINKKIWTSSYVVFTAGMALQFLAMCYWLIEVKGYKKWAWPFMVYGTNAIAVFFASGIVARVLTLIKWTAADGKPIALKTYIYQHWFASWAGPMNGSLFMAIAYIILWLLILIPLYRNKIFIKI